MGVYLPKRSEREHHRRPSSACLTTDAGTFQETEWSPLVIKRLTEALWLYENPCTHYCINGKWPTTTWLSCERKIQAEASQNFRGIWGNQKSYCPSAERKCISNGLGYSGLSWCRSSWGAQVQEPNCVPTRSLHLLEMPMWVLCMGGYSVSNNKMINPCRTWREKDQ